MAARVCHPHAGLWDLPSLSPRFDGVLVPALSGEETWRCGREQRGARGWGCNVKGRGATRGGDAPQGTPVGDPRS